MSKNDRHSPQKLRKTFISIKRGLSEDPKHRERMGNRVWLYMHIVDKADWETGIVYDWKDKDEAADMVLGWRTLQDQRQELEKLGYIKCSQRQHSLDILIYSWINPRSYSGEVLNKRSQGTEIPVPSQHDQGTGKSVPSQPQDTGKSVSSQIPGYDAGMKRVPYPFNKDHRSHDEVADATRLRAEALANIRGWNEVLVRLAIAFSEESGIALPNPKSGSKSNGRKKGKNEFAEVQKKWRAPLVELFTDQCGEDETFTAQVIRDAVKKMRADDFTISDPNSILKNAKSVAGKKRTAARANGNGNGHGTNGNGNGHGANGNGQPHMIEGAILTEPEYQEFCAAWRPADKEGRRALKAKYQQLAAQQQSPNEDL